MSYIGKAPTQGIRNRFYYTATSGQTTFSGADDNGLTLAYADARYTDVYLNGVLLVSGTDYTATTGTSITLTTGAAASDNIEILTYEISSLADVVSATSGGTFDGAVTFNSNISADGGTIKLDGNYPVSNHNVALGNAALNASMSGTHNVAIGSNTLCAITTGCRNVMLGYNSGLNNTCGAENTVVGDSAFYSNINGAYNVAVGRRALQSNTASNNVGVGYDALKVNTTGTHNVAVGAISLDANTTGVRNTALGYCAMTAETTGESNVAIGTAAMALSNGSCKNVAIGRNALLNNVTGSFNTVVGEFAGGCTTSSCNTFIGDGAGSLVTTGSHNTVLGRYSGNQGGFDIRTLSCNIVLSDGAGTPRMYYYDNCDRWTIPSLSGSVNSCLAALSIARDDASRQIVFGRSNTGVGEGGIGADVNYAIRLYSGSGVPVLQVTQGGALSKCSGSFRIDHPLPAKTDTHYLYHSFVESPYADNIYSGHTALNNGIACVNIDCHSGMTDGTFEALNRCFRVFTSNESGWDPVKGSIVNNCVVICSCNTSSADDVSWLVIGERQDQHMYDTDWTDDNGKVIVEREKTPEDDLNP